MANWVGCTILLCPLDGLLTQGSDNVVDSEDLGKGGHSKSDAFNSQRSEGAMGG